MILPASVVLRFSPGRMSTDIHIQKALLAYRKSQFWLSRNSHLFHPFAELLEFQKKPRQEALMQEGSYPGQLPRPRVIGGIWLGKDSLCACPVLPAPFLSSLLLQLAGICSFWHVAENPVFAIAP